MRERNSIYYVCGISCFGYKEYSECSAQLFLEFINTESD
jgi:hypothetical protein